MFSNSVMNTSKVNTPMDTSKIEMASKDISFESGRFGGAQPMSLMSSCDPNVLVPEQTIKPVEGVVLELPDEESLSIDRTQSFAQSSMKAGSDKLAQERNRTVSSSAKASVRIKIEK